MRSMDTVVCVCPRIMTLDEVPHVGLEDSKIYGSKNGSRTSPNQSEWTSSFIYDISYGMQFMIQACIGDLPSVKD